MAEAERANASEAKPKPHKGLKRRARVRLPGRTGWSPTRNPHGPGRAQLRHPVLQNRDSLDIRVNNTGTG